MDYDKAVELLNSPETWCEGAETLEQTGDQRALLPLVRAYEMRYEGSRLCLLQAMRALNPVGGAHTTFDDGTPEERRLMVHLMELFPDENHVSRLGQAVEDEDEGLRIQAARTLVTQPQTPAWEGLMTRLLDTPDIHVRRWIVEGLGYCRRDSARDTLRAHLGKETNPALKDKIEKALSLQ